MAGHTFTDADFKSIYEPLPEGEYECVIENIEKKTFIEKSGVNMGKENIYLQFTYKVRDDLNPTVPYAGTKISFQNVFPTYDREKKQFIQRDGWVDFNTLGKILVTQKDKSDYKKDFDKGLEEFILYMTGRVMICVVKQREDEYNGEKRIQNVVRAWKPTIKGNYVKAKPATNSTGGVVLNDIPDEDLPF